MKRFLGWFLVAMTAVLAAAALGVTWNDRADGVCRKKAPERATGYAFDWEWSEFAYVCEYRGTDAPRRRVGVIDAFHGEVHQHR